MAFTPEHKKQPGPERVKERWPCDIFSSPPAGGQILSPGEQSSSTEAFLLVTMVITCAEPGREGRFGPSGSTAPAKPLPTSQGACNLGSLHSHGQFDSSLSM